MSETNTDRAKLERLLKEVSLGGPVVIHVFPKTDSHPAMAWAEWRPSVNDDVLRVTIQGVKPQLAEQLLLKNVVAITGRTAT